MAKKPTPKAAAPKSPKRSAESANASTRFTDDERAAMRERAAELKNASRAGSHAGKTGEEDAVLARLADMPPPDRALGERLHALIMTNAPELEPKLWYGMPAYAKDGKNVCFFQAAQKFKTRYATLGFSDKAALDDGHMWPTSFALQALTPADEARIVTLVKKAVR